MVSLILGKHHLGSRALNLGFGLRGGFPALLPSGSSTPSGFGWVLGPHDQIPCCRLLYFVVLIESYFSFRGWGGHGSTSTQYVGLKVRGQSGL